MIKKYFYVVLIGIFLVLVSGCASINSNIPFQYQPSLIAVDKRINKSVGINMFEDIRPEKDKGYTKSIKDLPEKVTAKVIEDFEKSKIFDAVHYPTQETDDLVINGKINRFMWQMYSSTVSYIPGVNLALYFGAPAYEAYAVADITLEVKDNRTGKILGNFNKSSEIKNPHTLYNVKAGEYGAELAEAFRDVIKALKEDILLNLDVK